MPASKRPVRKRAAPKRKQAETVTPDSRASRTAAKRRKTGRSAVKDPHSDESGLVPEAVEDDTDDALSAEIQELADTVIPNLAVSSEFVAAVRDWTNQKIEDRHGNIVSAYAKICGRDWTYYVKSPTVNIGRPPDGSSRPNTSLELTPPLPAGENPSMVHIDLGPSKLVSRLHARLFFDQDDSKWHVNVNGRNGVKVNDETLRQGQRRVINSGDVMEIAGTQMMFVAAKGQAVIHPMFLENMQSNGPGYEEPQDTDIFTEGQAETQLPGEDESPSLAHSSAKSGGAGQALIAPAPPDFVRPSTPTRSPKKPGGKSGSGVKQSPGYGRGIMMESSENIDYRSSATRDIKPNWSYSTMISQAIMSTEEQVLCLDGIYKWIMANFSYYRHSNVNWQNSIRHNLSLSTAFTKVPRNKDDPGKGSNWTIVPEKRAELVAALEKQMKRSGLRRSSGPSSPATREAPIRSQVNSSQPYYTQESRDELKASPSNHSPPLSSYPPVAQESFTPSRGPQLAPYGSQQALPTFSDDPSPLAARRPPGRTARATGSSPTLTSGAWLQEYHPNSIMTPAPRPHNLNLPLPNTVRLPTSHMPDSSPAPFWKWTDQPSSTPARWPGEISPLKGGGGGGGGGERERERRGAVGGAVMQSSSPPPVTAVANGLESPTGGRGFVLSSIRGGYEGDDEEGGFDLTKGFPKISSYHHHRSNAVAGKMVS